MYQMKVGNLFWLLVCLSRYVSGVDKDSELGSKFSASSARHSRESGNPVLCVLKRQHQSQDEYT